MPHLQSPDTNGNSHEEYRPSSQYHSQPSTLRVICVGAGPAGLLVAYKMKQMFGDNYELVMYEKNTAVGGTWFENRYPGCACDVPAHAYTFSFEPNPNWSSFYASAPEIRQYFQSFADKYDLEKFIKFQSKVCSAAWDEGKGQWDVEVDVDGHKVHDRANVLINGAGFLNDWKWPAIPGLHDFNGKLLHTAAWDADMSNWSDKTVAVIGTGSSAIQAVPRIQKTAKHLTAFMRSVTWISPPIGGEALEAEKGKDKTSTDVASADDVEKPMEQYYYSEEDKKKFREDPKALLKYRRELETSVNSLFDVYLSGSETSKAMETAMRKEMHRRIGPGHNDLKDKLIPSWSPGCRRITPGDGYLEALTQPNVTTVHEEIEKIVPEGLVDAKGDLHKVDILVCATGFNIAFAPPWEVTGMNGVKMSEEFDPEPNVYLAMTVPKFPSYFLINGVRGCWANGTALPAHEACVDYIMKCCKKIQDEQLLALEVKQEPVTQLYEHIDAWHLGSVWSQDCKSWYKNNVKGGKIWLWGGSAGSTLCSFYDAGLIFSLQALHFMKTIEAPKWEHYDVRYRSNNMWSFLGNGRVEAEIAQDKNRLAPYIRSSDTPWHID